MKEVKKREVQYYEREDGRCPVASWIDSLDETVRHRIKARLDRILLGNLGEHRNLLDDLFELKIDFGPGYRLYYSETYGRVILLLCAGDKKTQRKDIALAREYLRDYHRRILDGSKS